MSSSLAPQSPPGVPSLVPLGAHEGQRPMTLNRVFTLIGSAPSARLYLPSKAVSRCHAVIINTDTGFFVRDLASRTLVLVNGRAVQEADLRDGDTVQVGPFTFRFTDPDTSGGKRRPRPAAPPQAALHVEGLSEPIPVEGRIVLIGRRETADISLTENSASSAHAVIIASGGKHVVRDLNSRTGTFVNGTKIHEHVLARGDTLLVGETTMRYVPSGAPAPAVAPPAPLHSKPAAAPEAREAVTRAETDEVAITGPAEDARDLLPIDPAPANADAEDSASGVAGAEDPVGLLESTEQPEPESAPSTAMTSSEPVSARADAPPADSAQPPMPPETTAETKSDEEGQRAVAAESPASDEALPALVQDADADVEQRASSEDIFEDVGAYLDARDREGAEAAAAAVPSPAVPSPAVPSPAIPSPAAPSPAAPSPAIQSPLVPPPAAVPTAPRPAAAPAPGPKSPPAHRPWGTPKSRPAANPNRAASPPGGISRPAAANTSPPAVVPPPPTPPAAPARPAPGTRSSNRKPSRPAPPRPSRPRSPFDLVPSAEPDPLDLLPDDLDRGDTPGRNSPPAGK